MSEFYFTVKLTESEHSIVKSVIECECLKRELTLIYYRTIKNGHIPQYRECKIEAPKYKVVEMLNQLDIEFDNIHKS